LNAADFSKTRPAASDTYPKAVLSTNSNLRGYSKWSWSPPPPPRRSDPTICCPPPGERFLQCGPPCRIESYGVPLPPPLGGQIPRCELPPGAYNMASPVGSNPMACPPPPARDRLSCAWRWIWIWTWT
jgi:hypothetical protein